MASCESAGPEESGPNAVEEVQSSLNLYNNIATWDNNDYVVPVCWNTAEFIADKATIRAAILDQWQGRSGIRFTDWGTCQPNVGNPGNRYVPIRLVNVPTEEQWGGFGAGGMGARLTGTPVAQIELRLSPARRRIRFLAVHEMGHALGLEHEDARPDRSGVFCGGQGIFPGQLKTIYDPISIMNSCRDVDGDGQPDPAAVDNPTISAADQTGMQRVYGAPTGRFRPAQLRNADFCPGSRDCHLADVNGDNRDDLVAFVKSTEPGLAEGDVFVSLSTGTGFGSAQLWSNFFCVGQQQCEMGDFNHDGRADVLAFDHGTSLVWVALSNGSGLGGPAQWHSSFCGPNDVCRVGDVDGNGFDDILAFTRGTTADVFIAASFGSSFGTRLKAHDFFCQKQETCLVGDVNGDGRTDLIALKKSTEAGTAEGDVFVALGNPGAPGTFGSSVLWHDFMCVGAQECAVADINGDGKTDLMALTKSTAGSFDTGDLWAAIAGSASFGPSGIWSDYLCVGNEQCAFGDVTGDNKADAVAFAKSAADVWVGPALPNQ